MNKKKCKCKSNFQDKKYGKGIRVHNQYARGWCCTVCKNERSLR